jgi:hypothetical protein
MQNTSIQSWVSAHVSMVTLAYRRVWEPFWFCRVSTQHSWWGEDTDGTRSGGSPLRGITRNENGGPWLKLPESTLSPLEEGRLPWAHELSVDPHDHLKPQPGGQPTG